MDGCEQAEKESTQGRNGVCVEEIWKGLERENMVRKDLTVEDFQGWINTFMLILRVIGDLNRNMS